MNDEQLFRPFDANSHPMTTLPVAPAPAVAPTTPTTGDGYYSRQLLFAPDLDNPEGKTPMGSHMPAGEMPWWFMLIGAAALGMRRKRRELKAKN
jgi:MYXO-CTERM domain-containing protein